MQHKRITNDRMKRWNSKEGIKKNINRKSARKKKKILKQRKKEMFPIFIAYFESVVREESEKERRKIRTGRLVFFFFHSLFFSPSISSIWSNILLIFLFGSLALWFMRAFVCVRLMINSISVLFPFKYFIPFRPFAHRKQCVHNRKTNFLFLPTLAKQKCFSTQRK